MTPQVAALQFLNGLTLAALLFMLASGFTLVFGLMRIMNLAHGGFYLIGGYIGLSTLLATQNFVLAVVAAGIAIALLGLFTERLLLRRLRGDTLAEVLLTIGLAYMLGDMALAVWGGDPRNIRLPGSIGSSIDLLD